MDENDYKIQNSSLIDVDTSIIGFNAAVEFITVELLLTMSNTDDVNTDDLSLTWILLFFKTLITDFDTLTLIPLT